jgi:hypothetical protein
MEGVGWAKATTFHEELSTGQVEWGVSWNDGMRVRRALFLLMTPNELRCDLIDEDGSVCCLPKGHRDPHVPISPAQSALPVILAR